MDISDWSFEKVAKSSMGPITFRTWDFAGQREFQSIYQYFFTRRTLYLICWKANDFEAADEIVDHIDRLLINIQVSH